MKIKMTSEEIKNLKHIGSGSFGDVYQYGDFILKRYKGYVRNFLGEKQENPCLKLKKSKFKKLNKRDKALRYTDTNFDLVYIDGVFGGVLRKYYEGEEFQTLSSKRLILKKKKSLELIRNVIELNKHLIYCLDCKDDNVLITENGEVKLIDLDDSFTTVTSVPNPILKKMCFSKVRKTINGIFYNNLLDFSDEIGIKFANYKNMEVLQNSRNYRELKKNIMNIDSVNGILFLKLLDFWEVDLNVLKNFLVENDFKLVLGVSNSFEIRQKKFFIEDILNELEKYDIFPYDAFSYNDDYVEKINEYILSHDSSTNFLYQDSKILEKK